MLLVSLIQGFSLLGGNLYFRVLSVESGNTGRKAKASHIPLDIAVLLRLAGLDVRQADTFSPSPALQAGTDIFRAVIATDFFGAASPFDYLFKRPHDTLGGK